MIPDNPKAGDVKGIIAMFFDVCGPLFTIISVYENIFSYRKK